MFPIFHVIPALRQYICPGKGKVDPRFSLRQEDPQITIRRGAEMVSVQPGGFDLDDWDMELGKDDQFNTWAQQLSSQCNEDVTGKRGVCMCVYKEREEAE